MFGSVWKMWMKRLARPTSPLRGPGVRRPGGRLRVESLEDRVTPANNVTVIAGPAGSGSLDAFLADGILTTAEGGAADGTISAGALAGVPGATNLSVSALGSIAFNQGAPLTLQTAPGRTATFTAEGGPLTVNAGSGVSTSGGALTLIADNIDIQQTVSAGAGAVTLAPFSPAQVINLGGVDAAGTLGLTDTELGRVFASVVRVGTTANTGGITVSAPIGQHPGHNTLALVTGGGVTQTAPLLVANLRVSSASDAVLTHAGNDVDNLAAAVTGTGNDFAFRDSDDLRIAAVDGVSGISTTVDPLSVISLQAGTTTQAAGANIVGTGLALLGTGPFTLTNPGNDVFTLAANVLGAVSYTDANFVRVGTVGATSSVLTANSPIALTTVDGDLILLAAVSAGAGSVSLTAGGTPGQDRVIDIQAGTGVGGLAGVTLTADVVNIQSAVDAGTNVASIRPFETNTSIELGNGGTGTLQLSDAELDFVNAGVVRVGRSDGTGNLTVTAAISQPAGWNNLWLTTGGVISDVAGGSLAVTSLALQGQAVNLLQTHSVTNLAGTAGTVPGDAFRFTNSGSLNVTTVDGVPGIAAAAGNIVLAGPGGSVLTVSQPIQTGAGDISLTFDDAALNAAVTAGGAGGDVDLTTASGNRSVTLGADLAGTLGLTDAELDRVTAAGRLKISTTSGNITVAAPVTSQGSGYTGLWLVTNTGAVADLPGASLGVANLGLQSGTGIGSAANPFDVAVTNLSFSNGDGPVRIADTGGLTITNLFGIGPAVNNGTTTNITAASGPVVIAVNLTSGGDLSVTAGDSGAPGDNLVVNSGVTVQTTDPNARIDLLAGDDVVLQAGSAVTATGGISLIAGNADSGDGLGTLVLNGTVTAGFGTTLTLQAIQDIALTGAINHAGGTVNVASTQGAIVDGNDPPTGTPNITATTLNLTAARGIGSGPGVDNPLEVDVDTLTATNTVSGDVRVVSVAGNVAVSGSNAGAGPFAVTALGAGSVLTVANTAAANDIASGVGGVILTADDMSILGTIAAPGGVVTLTTVTPTRPIDLGTDAGGTLGLTDTELDRITATTVRVGDAANTGGITVSQSINQGLVTPTYQNLSLRTAGAITQLPGAAIILPNASSGLALQGATGVTLGVTTNDVGTVAAAATAGGAGVTYFDANALTIGTVDGVSGVTANAAPVDVETFNGPLTVSNTPAANDVDSAGGNVTLIARGPSRLLTLASGASVRSAGGAIVLQADNMDLATGGGQSVNSGAGRTTLKPFTNGAAVNLGGADGVLTLGLTAAELNVVTADTLQVGDALAGNVTVTAAVNPGGVQVLALQTGGTLGQNVGATITARNLAIRAANAVNLTEANNVTTGALAAVVTTGGQGFAFTDANGLVIGAVDGLNGVTTNGGPITVTAATGGITVDQNVTAGAGAISLLANGADNTLANNATISNSGGNPIVLRGDRMVLGGGTITAAGGGRVTLEAATAGRLIDLGTTSDGAANTLGLSDAELATVGTAGALQVGSPTAGAVSITAPIAVGTGAFSIVTGAGVSQSATLAANSLRVTAGGAVNLPLANNVAVLAANVTGAGLGFTYTDADNLQIGNVDGVSGITTSNGPITVQTDLGDLLVNNNVLAGTGAVALTAGGAERLLTVNPFQVAGGGATLTADRMHLAGAVNVGTGTVTLQTVSTGRPINLGTAGDPAGSLNLTDGELDAVTAGLLRIGSAASGSITVTAPVTLGTTPTLSLRTQGSITAAPGGSIAVTNLAVSAATGPVNLSNPNGVGTLAARGTTVDFVNAGDLFVGTVDGLAGVAGGSGVALKVNNPGGLLTVQAAVDGGSGNVTLTADDMDLQAPVTAPSGTAFLQPTSAGRVIALGANTPGTLGLIDAELDRVTATLLKVGSAANAGGIQVAGPVTQAGSGYTTLSLVTGGSIQDLTPLDQADITVNNLALSAATGIGSLNDIDVAVQNLAAANTAAGNLRVTSTTPVTVPATPINGVTGATNTAPGGAVELTGEGGVTVAGPVVAAGGGDVTISTGVTGGSIAVTGSVTAAGGNGNVLLDATAAGSVTIANGAAAADVFAAGTGGITVRAGGSVGVAAGAVIQSGQAASGGGPISITANLGQVSGTANVDLGAGAQLLTRGDITVNADPDLNGTGGTILTGPGTTLAAPGGGLANALSLTAAPDMTLPDLRAVSLVAARSTGGSLRDDLVETAVVRAPTVSLTAARAIGGANQIGVADVLQQSATFRGAIDLDLPAGATLTVAQTGLGGNVQLRYVTGPVATSTLPVGLTPVGTGNQLAVITSTGDLTVDTPYTLAAAGNPNLLLAATAGGVVVNAALANPGTGTVTLVAGGGEVAVNAPVTSGGTINLTSASNAAGDGVLINASVTATGAGAGITAEAARDVVISNPAAAVTTTSATGGPITLAAARSLPGAASTGGGVVHLAGTVSTAANNSAITITAGQAGVTGGDITLAAVTAGTGPVSVRTFGGSVFDANGAGVANVTGGAISVQSDGQFGINLDVFTAAPATAGLTALTSNDPIQVRGLSGTQLQVSNVNAGTGSVTLAAVNGSLTGRNPGDLVAEVTGGTVTLTATGTGTIGLSDTAFLEINATNLNASSTTQLWISDVAGGVGINTVNAPQVVTLQSANGVMTSTTADGVADVISGTVVLRGVNNGSFGAGPGNPLEIAATGLNAVLAGSGALNVRDTGGGLNVLLAQTASGPISLEAAGPAADLTLTQVASATGLVTLNATGAVVGTAGGPADVAGAGLAVVNATGVGSAGSPLETAVGQLAASVGAGGVFVNNAGSVTVGSVGGVNGITTSGGAVQLTTQGSAGAATLTVDGPVTATGDVALTAAESVPAAAGDNLTVAPGAVVSSSGAVTLRAGDALTLAAGGSVAAGGAVVLAGGFNDDGSGGAVSFLGSATGSSVSVLGGFGPDAIVVNPVSTNGTVPIDGQAGADSISVTPSAATTFNVTGGAPAPGGPTGDRLDVATAGTTNPVLNATFVPGAGYSGSWTFSGLQAVNFNTIEVVAPTVSLSASITDGLSSAVPGTTIGYTVTFANAGPSTATGVPAVVTLPAALTGVTFTSAASGGATGNTPSGTGAPSQTLTIPAGGSVTYTVTGRISPSAAGSLVATATVSAPAATPDLTGAVHTATDTTNLTPSADVGVTTTAGRAPTPGGTVTYSVTVVNNGPSDAQGVSFTDQLPANASFVTVVQTGGPLFEVGAPAVGESGAVTGTIATLPAGASATFQVTVKVFAQPGARVTNSVSAASATADPNAANGSSSASVTVTPPAAPPRVVTGPGPGGGPTVLVFDPLGGALIGGTVAFDDSFRSGVNVAQGDVTGDGIADVIAGTAPGGGPNVKVFDGRTGAEIRSFFAYDANFRGGVQVAAGDVTGDGIADILAGAGVGGGPNVKVFDGRTGAEIRSFFAYDAAFRGGVNVGAGDINGDGLADIIAGSGLGGGPHVRAFDGRTGGLLRSFFAFDAGFRTGVRVAAGDLDGDGFAEILTASGPGGGPVVRVFDGQTNGLTHSFFAFDASVPGGASVAAVDVNSDGRAEIVVGAGLGLPPKVKVFDGRTLAELNSFDAYDADFLGGVYVS